MACLVVCAFLPIATAYHDCVQPARGRRLPPSFGGVPNPGPSSANDDQCAGGLCVGMHNGPHEGGASSYKVGTSKTGYTSVSSKMTVPVEPENIDGITYYIWTDVFFGDMSLGKMNQFVPQLILGSALDSSSGPPAYKPAWGTHKTWQFGAHYFFETNNLKNNESTAYAAYGKLYNTTAGEVLFTSFTADDGPHGPRWTLEMGVVGDASRVSKVVADQPYMGLGKDWPVPTTSWSELNYTNMCINACWELYGANDRAHLPGSGSQYDIQIVQPNVGTFPWVTKWDEDEGSQKRCPASTIRESHNDTVQHVNWDIFFPK